MANLPITDILMPDENARGRMVVATAAVAAGAGPGVVTITLDDAYPPIDRNLACPIMAILAASSDVGAMVALDTEGYNIVDTMPVTAGVGVAPDSVGEFLVTGDRTINIYQSNAVNIVVLVAYISKGSGTKV